MSNKKKIEVQTENCKTCGGTGRNYWLGPQKPHLNERLCSECWGVGKRPIQHVPDELQAVEAPTAPVQAIGAPETPPTVAEAGGLRELSPDEVAKELKSLSDNNRYADFDEMDACGPGMSCGYAEDATPQNVDQAQPKPD